MKKINKLKNKKMETQNLYLTSLDFSKMKVNLIQKGVNVYFKYVITIINFMCPKKYIIRLEK